MKKNENMNVTRIVSQIKTFLGKKFKKSTFIELNILHKNSRGPKLLLPSYELDLFRY